MDPNTGSYPMDSSENDALPQALLAQYPALAQMDWSGDMGSGSGGGGSGVENDASDYNEGDDGSYVNFSIIRP
jgi:hypothetical protein